MRRLLIALAALILLRADMYPDASNAKLPEALNNLTGGASLQARQNLGITRNVTDFGARCDVKYQMGSYTIPAGGTTVTLTQVAGTASIAGNIMTVTAGAARVGAVIAGTGITPGTKVVDRGTGSGGTGTYIVSPAQTAASTAITAYTPFEGIGETFSAVLAGQAAGGLPLYTTLTPTSATTATLGAPVVPGSLTMMATGLLSKNTGSGYVPGDTITMAGGTLATTGGTPTIGTVQKTFVRTATIAAGGTGGTNGTHEVYGTSGNGMRLVGNLTVAGGIATGIAITDGGHYTTNPATPTTATIATAAPGVTLPSGVTLNLTMDVDLIAPTTPGLYGNTGIPSEYTQASTSGSGTGATFTPMAAYNTYSMVYGTDDSAAFNTALNPQLWPTPQTGAVIEMPERPCGIASTVTRSGSSVELRGTVHNSVLTAQTSSPPEGSVLQWMGAVGGTMFRDQPFVTPPAADRNKILGVGFHCGIPNGIGQMWPVPVAAVGLDARGQEMPEYGWLSFEACTKYNMYTDGISSANFQHAEIHDITFQNGNYSDGVGLYYASGPSGADSDYAIIRNIWAVFQSAPVLYLGVLDNVSVKNIHAFKRGTQRVYGVDIAGPVYGTGETNHANSGFFEGISTYSVLRGLESSATPSTNVIIMGFDQANNAPVVEERPGHGNLTFMDYNGRMQLPPFNWFNATGTIGMGRKSIFNDSPFYIWGDNQQIVHQLRTADASHYFTLMEHDYSGTFRNVSLGHHGAAKTGDIMAGVPLANSSSLSFQNMTNSIIKTNTGPLVFGTLNTDRGRITSAGRWLFGTSTDCGAGSVCLGSSITPGATTVAALPTCNAAAKYATMAVSDQSGVPTYRGALTGGGALAVLAFCNGTSWEAH